MSDCIRQELGGEVRRNGRAMTRLCLAVAVLIATTGAAPRRTLPVPPIPPARPPADQTAPLPNRDVQAPITTSDTGMQVRLQDFRVRRLNQSYGYTPGSQYEGAEDKRAIQTPGLTLRVPLQ
ncbi:MAG: hypothetical protein WDN25_10960 [Acetobacteraceae bacterium]